MKKIFLFSFATLLFFSCSNDKDQSNIIGQQDYMPGEKSILLTPEAMWAMGRISDIQISPNKKQILFGITWYDAKQNKGNRDLYIMDTNGENKINITNSNEGEYNACWKDDEHIGFLSTDDKGIMQFFEMEATANAKRYQKSFSEQDISGFSYSPDKTKIAYIMEVMDSTIQDRYADLDKADARIYDDLMFRHWDHWVISYTHLFIADLGPDSISNSIDLLKGTHFETPMKPFGGMEQIAWSPNSKSIVYTCKKKLGKDYALSTNSDLYLYNLDNKKTSNLTSGIMGYDWNPVFSPDGSKLAWESMEHDGYESDKQRLFVLDFKTNTKIDHTAKYDSHVSNLRWSSNSKSIFFVSPWHGTQQIYEINLANDSIVKLTEGLHDIVAFEVLNNNTFIAQQHSMSKPDEFYTVNKTSGEIAEISFVNKLLLDKLNLGNVEERWITTTDGKKMLTWVIYPPNFDSTKKYPAILYCQGGPQGMVGQFWSYRWNFQAMAANGYIVVAPNRRGTTGFGQEWLEQISGDYGGQNMKDYLVAIDSIAAETFVDENKLGAVGASYGGFSIYWLAGNHNGRFKAFIAHDGMFNLESQYLETEELWFTNWDLGGAYWESENTTAQKTYAVSPHKFVKNWDTPILIIHGEKDYRIAYTQALQAFTAAKLMGIPARLLLFPEENHWVLKPQNAILWQREFSSWLNKWLK